MLQHPDVRAIIKARDEYIRLKRDFIEPIISNYRSKSPTLESFTLFLDWIVYDRELIQEILARVEKGG